jgi:hypothetical protein
MHQARRHCPTAGLCGSVSSLSRRLDRSKQASHQDLSQLRARYLCGCNSAQQTQMRHVAQYWSTRTALTACSGHRCEWLPTTRSLHRPTYHDGRSSDMPKSSLKYLEISLCGRISNSLKPARSKALRVRNTGQARWMQVDLRRLGPVVSSGWFNDILSAFAYVRMYVCTLFFFPRCTIKRIHQVDENKQQATC